MPGRLIGGIHGAISKGQERIQNNGRGGPRPPPRPINQGRRVPPIAPSAGHGVRSMATDDSLLPAGKQPMIGRTARIP